MNPEIEALSRTVRIAARAAGRHGMAHAYGHCSARIDAGSFLVCPAGPMGLTSPGEACSAVSLEGALPPGVLGEVRIHREIYRRRPDVGGIMRSMPPKTMALGTLRRTPRPLHGFGSYFAGKAVLWDDPQLLRSDASASALAELLSGGIAALMRGNGLVIAGASIEEATVLTWYFEDAARLEIELLGTDPAMPPAILSPEECAARAIWDGRIRERMWSWLTAGDPEL